MQNVGAVPVRDRVCARPKPRRQEERLARQAYDTRPKRVEAVVSRTAEEERVRTRDAEREDQADREHNCEGDGVCHWAQVWEKRGIQVWRPSILKDISLFFYE